MLEAMSCYRYLTCRDASIVQRSAPVLSACSTTVQVDSHAYRVEALTTRFLINLSSLAMEGLPLAVQRPQPILGSSQLSRSLKASGRQTRLPKRDIHGYPSSAPATSDTPSMWLAASSPLVSRFTRLPCPPTNHNSGNENSPLFYTTALTKCSASSITSNGRAESRVIRSLKRSLAERLTGPLQQRIAYLFPPLQRRKLP